METKNFKINVVFGLLFVAFGFFGCQKKNNTPVVAQTYQVNQAGFCTNQLGQNVDQTLCYNQAGGAYIYHNGQCVQQQTGQPVSSQLCMTQQQNPNGAAQCYGNYIWQGHIYQCGTMYNCSGIRMIQVGTNHEVLCQ